MKKLLLFLLCLSISCITYAQRGQCSQNCGDDDYYSSHNQTYTTNSNSSQVVAPQTTVEVDYMIYPNPVISQFQIEEEAVKDGNAIKLLIRRMDGQVVKSFPISQGADYRISDLQAGQYFVLFLDRKNRVVQTKTLQKVGS